MYYQERLYDDFISHIGNWSPAGREESNLDVLPEEPLLWDEIDDVNHLVRVPGVNIAQYLQTQSDNIPDNSDKQLMYDEGISRAANILDMAEARGVIKKVGTWYAYGEDKLGQGKENARLFLKENARILGKIEKEVMVSIGNKGK